MFRQRNGAIPDRGYILPKWDCKGTYRATAIAYIQREGVNKVKNINGNWYSLNQLEEATLGKRN